MRLLNTHTLELKEFLGDDIPAYAILSHVWSSSELSYDSFQTHGDTSSHGYEKIAKLCELARLHGTYEDIPSLEWAWIDTICIDKRSSAELTEAINSMFGWYERSAVCYAFLPDVHTVTDDCVDTLCYQDGAPFSRAQFLASKWHTRGWTLQELLAPRRVLLMNSAYEVVAYKKQVGDIEDWPMGFPSTDFAALLSTAAGVDVHSMARPANTGKIAIAKKLSWSARRATTRGEDMTYCLLGLFDINMPLLYGEGAAKAFRRLQLELLSHSIDESIFAWKWSLESNKAHPRHLLATSPAAFAECNNMTRTDSGILMDLRGSAPATWNVTHRGLEVILPSYIDAHLWLPRHPCILWPLQCSVGSNCQPVLQIWTFPVSRRKHLTIPSRAMRSRLLQIPMLQWLSEGSKAYKSLMEDCESLEKSCVLDHDDDLSYQRMKSRLALSPKRKSFLGPVEALIFDIRARRSKANPVTLLFALDLEWLDFVLR